MKKYCIAYISFLDNELKQTIVESEEAEFTVLLDYFEYIGLEAYEDTRTIEDLKNIAFNCDSMVSIIEI